MTVGNPTRAARRYLSIPVCIVVLAVVGSLFVRDPTSTALAPFSVAVLAVSAHALSVGADAELASATLACTGAAVVAGLLLGVGAALAGDAWRAGAADVALSVTLAVALLAGYLVARRRS